MITRTLEQFRKEWAVYQIDINDMPFYIGCAPLADLYRFPDAENNSAFAELDASTTVTVSVLHTGPEVMMRDVLSHRIADRQPYANLHGQPVAPAAPRARGRHKGPVRCVETGVEYRTAGEAAKAVGVSPQAMSAHLNRRPSALTVGGHTFERVT